MTGEPRQHLSAAVYQALVRLYRSLPAKRALCHALRALPLPRDKFSADLRFDGPFTLVTHDRSSLQMSSFVAGTIENQLFWYGLDGWEATSLRLWHQLATKARVIFDVGANTGIYSLLAKDANRDATVCAFEPSARVFERLERNVNMNGLGVICRREAVSDQVGEATFFDFESPHQYSASLHSEMFSHPSRREVRVQTTRIDQVYRELGLSSLDLAKIDVELHEPQVLEGMGALLATQRPTLLIEILNPAVGAKIIKIVAGLDYLFFAIDEHSGAVRVEDLGLTNNRNYLLCSKVTAGGLGL